MIAIVIILLIMLLISMSSVEVSLSIKKENQNNKVSIKLIMLYGLIRLNKEINELKFVKEEQDKTGDEEKDYKVKIESDLWTKSENYTDIINLRKIKKRINDIKKYKDVIEYTINKSNFDTLYWKTEVGFDDAALTGLIIGVINIAKSNLFVMFNNIRLKPENIYFKAIPNFNRYILKTNIFSIFKVKIGHIIIAGLKSIRIMYTKK